MIRPRSEPRGDSLPQNYTGGTDAPFTVTTEPATVIVTKVITETVTKVVTAVLSANNETKPPATTPDPSSRAEQTKVSQPMIAVAQRTVAADMGSPRPTPSPGPVPLNPELCTHPGTRTFDITRFDGVTFSRVDCTSAIAIFDGAVSLDPGLSASIFVAIYKRLRVQGKIPRLIEELDDYLYQPADLV